MNPTTIKVSTDLRDRLKERAAAHGRTIGEHIDALLAEEARRERFAAVRRSMAMHPPDAEYERDRDEWQGDGWS